MFSVVDLVRDLGTARDRDGGIEGLAAGSMSLTGVRSLVKRNLLTMSARVAAAAFCSGVPLVVDLGCSMKLEVMPF